MPSVLRYEIITTTSHHPYFISLYETTTAAVKSIVWSNSKDKITRGETPDAVVFPYVIPIAEIHPLMRAWRAMYTDDGYLDTGFKRYLLVRDNSHISWYPGKCCNKTCRVHFAIAKQVGSQIPVRPKQSSHEACLKYGGLHTKLKPFYCQIPERINQYFK